MVFGHEVKLDHVTNFRRDGVRNVDKSSGTSYSDLEKLYGKLQLH